MKGTTRKLAATLAVNGALVAAAAATLLPLAWMVSASLMPTGEASQLPPRLLPSAPTLDHYRDLFERLLALRNDVGLLSEQYDTRAGRLVGNFPQAFTHVALVNSAFNLTRSEKPAEQRAHSAAERAPAMAAES